MTFRNTLIGGVLMGAAAFLPMAALAQAPAAPPPPAVANPEYQTVFVETVINKPAAEVWSKVGGYCDGEKYGAGPCKIIAGKASELGAVRVLNGWNIEMLVGKTDLSYTYTQPVRQGVPFNAYHGTFEAKPLTATTSKLSYAFVYDVSAVGPAARAAEVAARTERFNQRLATIKKALEAN